MLQPLRSPSKLANSPQSTERYFYGSTADDSGTSAASSSTAYNTRPSGAHEYDFYLAPDDLPLLRGSRNTDRPTSPSLPSSYARDGHAPLVRSFGASAPLRPPSESFSSNVSEISALTRSSRGGYGQGYGQGYGRSSNAQATGSGYSGAPMRRSYSSGAHAGRSERGRDFDRGELAHRGASDDRSASHRSIRSTRSASPRPASSLCAATVRSSSGRISVSPGEYMLRLACVDTDALLPYPLFLFLFHFCPPHSPPLPPLPFSPPPFSPKSFLFPK